MSHTFVQKLVEDSFEESGEFGELQRNGTERVCVCDSIVYKFAEN